MEDIPVIIPTHGRADRVSTMRHLPQARMCVEKSQLASYREHWPDHDFVVHGPEIDSLAKKRQWIWDTFGDVFMVDDDITSCLDLSRGPDEKMSMRGEEPYRAIQSAYRTAKALDVRVFGLSTHQRIIEYDPGRPFELTGFVSAHTMGLIGGDDRLYFRSDLSLVDDVWLCMLNAYYRRTLFVDNRYVFMHKDTFHNPGGLSRLRNERSQSEALEEIAASFGTEIVRIQRGREGLLKLRSIARMPFG